MLCRISRTANARLVTVSQCHVHQHSCSCQWLSFYRTTASLLSSSCNLLKRSSSLCTALLPAAMSSLAFKCPARLRYLHHEAACGLGIQRAMSPPPRVALLHLER